MRKEKCKENGSETITNRQTTTTFLIPNSSFFICSSSAPLRLCVRYIEIGA
jgi:hypothetical protein